MPRGGLRPGSGRPKGAVAKETIGAERARTAKGFPAARAPTQAEFDAYDQLEIIAKQFLNQAKRFQPVEGNAEADLKLFNEALRNASKVLKEMIPYQRPRLGSIEHKFGPIDLSRLDDAQLTAFETLLFDATVDPRGPDGEASPAH